jgi:acetyltransferase-like isoleucine patch superfamily enzyme
MARSQSKLIIGAEPWLDWARAEWADCAPDINPIPVALTQDAGRNLDFAPLAQHDPKTVTAFIAFGDQFLNLRRQELFMKLKELGYAMPPLIDKQALVAGDAGIGENSWIRKGAILGSGVRAGIGTHIGIASVIESGCNLGENVSVHGGARIGTGCKLGMFATVGANVTLLEGTQLAPFSRITKPGLYQGQYREAVFIEERFSAAILP